VREKGGRMIRKTSVRDGPRSRLQHDVRVPRQPAAAVAAAAAARAAASRAEAASYVQQQLK